MAKRARDSSGLNASSEKRPETAPGRAAPRPNLKISRASDDLLPEGEDPTVRITPLDVRNHVFPRSWSGYDREEVDTFLRMVSSDYELALRELHEMREKVAALEQRVHELLGNERLLQETLTTAQHLSEDLKQTALKEAELMVSEAEIQGEKVLDAAHRRAARLAEDLREMKLVRGRVAAGLRATLEHHLKLVEHLAEEPAGDEGALDGRIEALVRRREPRTPPAE